MKRIRLLFEALANYLSLRRRYNRMVKEGEVLSAKVGLPRWTSAGIYEYPVSIVPRIPAERVEFNIELDVEKLRKMFEGQE